MFPPVGDPQVLDRTAYTSCGIASAGGFAVLAKIGEVVNVAEIVSQGRYVQERLKQTVAIAKIAPAKVGEALGLRAGCLKRPLFDDATFFYTIASVWRLWWTSGF